MIVGYRGFIAMSSATPPGGVHASIPGMRGQQGEPTVAFSPEQMGGLLGSAVEGLGGLEAVTTDAGLEVVLGGGGVVEKRSKASPMFWWLVLFCNAIGTSSSLEHTRASLCMIVVWSTWCSGINAS